MSAFAKHGIAHLSASSLNLWREHPGLWATKYLAGVRDEDSPAAWRGKAVEDGMAAMLRGHDPAGVSMNTFEANAVGDACDEVEAERKLIAPMLKQVAAWTPAAPLIATQLKVEHWMDGVPVPVIGYLDFVFEDGLILDLKTTKACPSSPRAGHLRQVALYRAARANSPGALLYVTHAKHALYSVGDNEAAEAINQLRADALSLEAFLSRVDSARDALHCLPLNGDDFRVTDETKIAHHSIMAGV